MRNSRIQSAMEYLMTYGWAILIIAVVLGALFGLGFFNSANLAPKVAAGSCQVYRPQGPGTTSFINLEGTCNNELPQYVAYFNGGSSSYGTATVSFTGTPKTVTAWIYWNSAGGNNRYQIVAIGTNTLTYRPLAIWGGGATTPLLTIACDIHSSLVVSPNTWTFVGYSYDGAGNTVFYENSQSQSVSGTSGCWQITGTQAVYFSPGSSQIGTGTNFNGMISNVQMYNTSLTANEVTALYQEGIGGVPINLNRLVAWWPLNGNANDYSGNLDNGNSLTGVTFTGSWTSGYSAP